MIRPYALLLLLAASCGAPARGEDRYAIESREGKTIDAVLSYDVEAPKLVANEWIIVGPRPPELSRQAIKSATLSPGGKPASEWSEAHRPILAAKAAGKGGRESAIHLKAEFRATLSRRHLVALKPDATAPQVEAISDRDRKLFLARTAQCDWGTAEFQEWIDGRKLRRAAGESDVDLGRRAFLEIESQFQYEYTGTMDRRPSKVCGRGKSDCGGLSQAFVAVMRTNGVPARMVVGRWASSSTPGEKVSEIAYYQQHAKAEFYADAVGWVPVDLASAVLYDKKPGGLAYFGHDDGDFLVFHTDSDLILDTIHFGRETTQTLQGIVFWATGRGSFDGVKVAENWQVRDAPR